jgi:hypothetical protein
MDGKKIEGKKRGKKKKRERERKVASPPGGINLALLLSAIRLRRVHTTLLLLGRNNCQTVRVPFRAVLRKLRTDRPIGQTIKSAAK